MKRNTLRSFAEITLTWSLIGAALWVAATSSSITLKILLIAFIASRQYALIVLNHESFHGLLATRPKVNEWMGRFLLSFPLGSVFDVSRKKHLSHHQLLGREEDPDYVWYEPGQTNLLTFVTALPSRQAKYTYATTSSGAQPRRGSLAWVIAYQFTLLTCLTLWAGPALYLFFWVTPLFIAVLLDKLRSFCEHSSHLEANSLPVVRSFHAHPIEKFFLAPFDMNYHAEHHRFPSVPHYHLASLSERLRELEGGTHYRAEKSYLLSLWRHTREKRATA